MDEMPGRNNRGIKGGHFSSYELKEVAVIMLPLFI